jgi:hypothetical protein
MKITEETKIKQKCRRQRNKMIEMKELRKEGERGGKEGRSMCFTDSVRIDTLYRIKRRDK